jgi:hypothetical protein
LKTLIAIGGLRLAIFRQTASSSGAVTSFAVVAPTGVPPSSAATMRRYSSCVFSL